MIMLITFLNIAVIGTVAWLLSHSGTTFLIARLFHSAFRENVNLL